MSKTIETMTADELQAFAANVPAAELEAQTRGVYDYDAIGLRARAYYMLPSKRAAEMRERFERAAHWSAFTALWHNAGYHLVRGL